MEQKYKYNSYEQSNAPLMFHKSQSWDSTINAPSWPYILWDSSLSLHVKVTNTNWHLSIYREKHLSFSFYKAASQNSKILPPAPQQYTSQPLCWRAAFSCLKTNYFLAQQTAIWIKKQGGRLGNTVWNGVCASAVSVWHVSRWAMLVCEQDLLLLHYRNRIYLALCSLHDLAASICASTPL